MYTVITETRVLRVKARSIQHLTQALKFVGITFLGIHKDDA